MTIYRLIQVGVAVMALLTAFPTAAQAQTQNSRMVLCITKENTIDIVVNGEADCKQTWPIDASLVSMLNTLQHLPGVHGDYYKTLLEMVLAYNETLSAQPSPRVPQVPHVQMPHLLNGTSMIPGVQFPQPMSGAVTVNSSGGVGVSVSQQNGGPAVVTVRSGSAQQTFTVDSDD